MQTKEKYTVPSRTAERIARTVCDLCQATVKYDATESSGWINEPYQVDRITITRKKGHEYPEGSYIQKYSFDVCPNCWEKKLLPFFAEHGSKPREEENDY